MARSDLRRSLRVPLALQSNISLPATSGATLANPLLVKFALAMIPALFIIAAASALFWEVLGGLFGHHGQTTSM